MMTLRSAVSSRPSGFALRARALALALVLSGAFGLGARAHDDLTASSDEFDDARSLARWSRIHRVEGWGNDVLERIDVGTTRVGALTLVPHTSSWYEEWRGELMFKSVAGDFVVTAAIEPRNRAGNGAPGSLYSLAGILVRAPRSMTQPAEWTPRGQNYVFLSLGAANRAGAYQYEVKTTVNSVSTLQISDGAPASALIQVARIGPHLILSRRAPGGAWQVHRRYYRPDFPATLQAGITVYTDWPVCESVGYANHNRLVLTNGLRLPTGVVLNGCRPDLVATVDFVRYARPRIPANLVGADLSSADAVSDAQLLAFLGENATVPGGAASGPVLGPVRRSADGTVLDLRQLTPQRSYRLEASTDLTAWESFSAFVSTGAVARVTDPRPDLGARVFYRAVSP